MKRRGRFFVAGLSALLLAGVFATAADAAGSRRVSGDGKTISFRAGEVVVGVSITLRNELTWPGPRPCWMRAAQSGKVTTGVVNPWPGEIRGKLRCSAIKPLPGPRRITGDGKWGSFPTRTYVLAVAIETSTYTIVGPCLSTNLSLSGRAFTATFNPSHEEMKGAANCANAPHIFGKMLFTSSLPGDTVNIPPGWQALGSYLEYRMPDGHILKFKDCFAKQGAYRFPGRVWGGTRAPWSSDGLRDCGSPGTIVEDPSGTQPNSGTPVPATGNCDKRTETGAKIMEFPGGCQAVGWNVWIDGNLVGGESESSRGCWILTPVGSTVKVEDGVYAQLGPDEKSKPCPK